MSLLGTKTQLSEEVRGNDNMCTMLDQRQKRRVDVVQMLYKCVVFTGKKHYETLHEKVYYQNKK